MLGKTEQFGLSRRVVAYYLLFSLAAIVCLAAGAMAPSVVPLGMFAILASFLLIAAGTLVLRRTIAPIGKVQRQLRRAAVSSTLQSAQLEKVELRDPDALGWNRVIDRLKDDLVGGGLTQRLGEALHALRQSQFDQLLDSIPEGIAVTDQQGRICSANQACAAMLAGATKKSSLEGQSLLELLAGDETLDPAHRLADPSALQRTAVAEFTRNGGTGQRVLRASRHPVRSPQQPAVTRWIWNLRDVTQQKLAEKMRDEFLNSAAHELRTPLANIKAYAETLSMNEMLDVEQQKQFCNTITVEATRLARFIDDLLSVSSMEAGSLAIERRTVELDRLLDAVISKVRPLLNQKSITLETLLPPKLPEARLDKDKIAVALVNLLGNAAKYTPDGGRVALKVRVQDNRLIVEVEDNGIGVCEEELPRVFNKFFRSSDERVQDESGSGLGLSLAREVVRLHGGALTVESQLNQGSTFTLSLPLE